MEQNFSEPSIRVIIVGDSCVGKTTLLLRQTQRKFFDNSQTTTIASFMKSVIKVSDAEHVNLELWDTAGTEKYKSLSKVFYRAAQIAIICFSSPDLNERTLDTVNQWKKDVLAIEPKCKIVLVGTKSDLLPDDKRKFIEELGKLRNDSGIPNVYITSSVTGEGIDALFTAVATMAEPLLHHTPQELNTKSTCSC